VEKLARKVGERVRRATDGKSGAERGSGPRSWAFNAVVQAIELLSPLAIELLRALEGGHHLTRTQYQRLRRDPDLAVAIDELRDEDLLVPLNGAPVATRPSMGLRLGFWRRSGLLSSSRATKPPPRRRLKR
jgi:hypothetical protein